MSAPGRFRCKMPSRSSSVVNRHVGIKICEHFVRHILEPHTLQYCALLASLVASTHFCNERFPNFSRSVHPMQFSQTRWRTSFRYVSFRKPLLLFVYCSFLDSFLLLLLLLLLVVVVVVPSFPAPAAADFFFRFSSFVLTFTKS